MTMSYSLSLSPTHSLSCAIRVTATASAQTSYFVSLESHQVPETTVRQKILDKYFHKHKAVVCFVGSMMVKEHYIEHISQEFALHNVAQKSSSSIILQFPLRYNSNKPLHVFMLFATEAPHLSGELGLCLEPEHFHFFSYPSP